MKRSITHIKKLCLLFIFAFLLFLPETIKAEEAGMQATVMTHNQLPGWFEEQYTTGEIIQTEDSYQSPNIHISIDKVQENGVTYYVADIYVRSLQYLRTFFAKDAYGRGIRDTVKNMAEASGAILAITGDYYGNQLKGVVIRNGTVYRESVNNDVCVLYHDGTMKTYDEKSFTMEEAKEAYQAWSFGPKLLDDGQPMTKFNSKVKPANPRAAIGYYDPGHYCFVVVDGRQAGYSKGLNMQDLSNLFYTLGCKEAYNLDGGQTAQMFFAQDIVNQPYHGGRRVSDIIYIGE